MPDTAEQYTWWRARWRGGDWSPPELYFFKVDRNAEHAVRAFVVGLPASYEAVVECCTVTRTEWKEADCGG